MNLAELVWKKGLEIEIERKMEEKYGKRIDYLIGCNNELSRELEEFETILGMIDNFKKELKKKDPG